VLQDASEDASCLLEAVHVDQRAPRRAEWLTEVWS
jgi:hypothetical protein